MADSPTTNADGPVGVTLKTNGAEVADTTQINRIGVTWELDRIPEATVVIAAGSIPENDFPEIDGDDFKIGNDITIAAHYGAGDDQQIFAGVITAQRMRVTERGSEMELTCRDKAAALMYARKSALYAQMTDSDLAAQIIGDAGLTADVTSTSDTARDQLRHDMTDWGYLLLLAGRAGFVIRIEDGTVKLMAPDDSTSAVLTVGLGVDIVSFDATLDAEAQIATFHGVSWDDDTQQIVSADNETVSDLAWGNTSALDMAAVMGDRQSDFETTARVAEADLKTTADGRASRALRAGLRGKCAFTGSGAITPGDVLEITGVGERFGGNAYVGGVRHRIEAGSWITEALLGLPLPSAAAGAGTGDVLNAPYQGFSIGKVLQLQEDPDSRLRAKISLPVFGSTAAEVWARIAAPYATNNGGIQFLPEVDDEVLVGFCSADPNAPVIIGAMHNANAARPYEATADNFIKGIVLPQGMKLEFDEEKQIITILTPGGHSVVMDDDAETVTIQDLTGNKLEMASGGVTLSSPGDISISADGAIDIAAAGDATVNGQNATVEGSMGLTAKGGSSAELSSGGQTTVKGSMVMIN